MSDPSTPNLGFLVQARAPAYVRAVVPLLKASCIQPSNKLLGWIFLLASTPLSQGSSSYSGWVYTARQFQWRTPVEMGQGQASPAKVSVTNSYYSPQLHTQKCFFGDILCLGIFNRPGVAGAVL